LKSGCITLIELDVCTLCLNIVAVYDTWREDESGVQHQECFDERSDREQTYWSGFYRPAVHSSGGYDWGDPKNADYMNWVLDYAHEES
jgi:hypothetical protein